jgi:hypothetical protein
MLFWWEVVIAIFNLNLVENGKKDSSTEAHLKSSKASRGSYWVPYRRIHSLLKYLNFFSWTRPFKSQEILENISETHAVNTVVCKNAHL